MVVIIPAYEPDKKLVKLISELYENTNYRILVVNDGSAETKIFDEIRPYAQVLIHEKNCGKGAAIKTAMEYILDNMPYEDGLCTADADGQHKVQDIQRICTALTKNDKKLILGTRCFDGKIPLRSKLGNKITEAVFSAVSGKKLSDTQTGLRAFSTKLIPFMLDIKGNRYEYEMNVLLECAENGIEWLEVPIETVYLDEKNTSSHFNTVKDSFRIYCGILKFSGSSFLSFLLDYALFNLFMTMTSGFAIVWCNIAARIMSSVFNYCINRKYVFKSKDNPFKTAIQYFLLAICILAANSLILKSFTYIGISAAAAKILTEITLFICSLTVQRFFIFKPIAGKTPQ